MKSFLASVLLITCTTLVHAFEFDSSSIYGGAALAKNAYNDFEVDDSMIFTVGHPIDVEVAEFELSAEFQIWTSDEAGDGNFIGATGIRDFSDVLDNLSAVGRLGFLMGDADDELQFGGGAEYSLNDNFSARSEYLFAGDLESFTIGFIYRQ